jgi:hypothetical protein
MRNFLDDSIVEHKSKPPLRWVANWAGSIASHAILKIVYMEEDEITTGFKYKAYGFLYNKFWPLYREYGTTYRLRMDLSGKSWDDYDDNGIPYWEKTGTIDPDYVQPWNYEDPETGDAFRLIKNEKISI